MVHSGGEGSPGHNLWTVQRFTHRSADHKPLQSLLATQHLTKILPGTQRFCQNSGSCGHPVSCTCQTNISGQSLWETLNMQHMFSSNDNMPDQFARLQQTEWCCEAILARKSIFYSLQRSPAKMLQVSVTICHAEDYLEKTAWRTSGSREMHEWSGETIWWTGLSQ